jgi:hypothetical protein
MRLGFEVGAAVVLVAERSTRDGCCSIEDLTGRRSGSARLWIAPVVSVLATRCEAA